MVEYKREESELYQAIGVFVVSFEFITAEMKSLLQAVLTKAGLNNATYLAILTHDSTAQPLISYLRGFINEAFKEELKEERTNKIVKKLYRDIEDAISKRNEVVHAHWYLNFYDGDLIIKDGDFVIEDGDFATEKEPYLSAIKYKIKKDGIENVFSEIDMQKIEELNMDAKQFQSIATLLNLITDNIYDGKHLTDSII